MQRLRSATIRRALGAALIAALMPVATTGCFGGFRLTDKVYDFNRDISHDKWVRWLAFLVLVIVPIYGIAMLVDAVLANSLEFWTGKNPIAARVGETRHVRGPGGEEIRMTLRADGKIDVLARAPDVGEQRFVLAREADAVAAYDAEGRLIARAGELAGRTALLPAGAN